MVKERRPKPTGGIRRPCSLVLQFAAGLALLAGCRVADELPDDRDVLPSWRALLPDTVAARGVAFDPCGVPPLLEAGATLVVVDQNWREPAAASSEPCRELLRRFVDAGGSLVLFGHAARLVHDLGIEGERPECAVYRWGYDRRAVRGDARLMLHVVSGELDQLFEPLVSGEQEHVYAVAGGQPCTAPVCSWQVGGVQNGKVLARLAKAEDGRLAAQGPPVLVRFRSGKGTVLACGLVPDLDHTDETVAANAAAFVRGCIDWARAAAGAGVVLADTPDRTPAVASLPDDGPPMVPLLAHWGWQVGVREPSGDGVRAAADLVDNAVLPAWRYGADVVEFELTGAEHGSPLTWSPRDPIAPPRTWRGASGRGASRHVAGDLRAVVEEAHVRGLLAFGGLDPLPVGDRPTERLVALRLHARELADVRRFGDGALDGFGVRQWWRDRQGYGIAMVHEYRPDLALYGAGEQCPAPAGAIRALDADDGGVHGLSLSGVADGWRDGFPADAFPIGVLDARATGDRWPGNGVRGGGSHADWLVRQFHSFVRDRGRQGGTALWRRLDPRTLGHRTVDYVHGLGLEPLRAAVAMSLAATGRNGIREAAARLVDDVPSEFVQAAPAPASVHVLQNNWFRLLGSAGPLQVDLRGQASFERGAIEISSGFLSTRLFGGRPNSSALPSDRHDFLQAGRGRSGGYGELAQVSSLPGGDAQVPALLAVDGAPQWPRVVACEWRPAPGYHELHLRLRSVRGNNLCAVWLGDVMLQAFACREQDEPAEHVLPVHIAQDGLRTLKIELVDGQQVAIDELRVQHAGDIGVEAEVVVPAGSVAQLVERSRSSFHDERVTLTTMADVPAFVAHTHCERAVRNLQVERTMTLPHYVRVSAATDGDDPKGRRKPFALTGDDPDVPDVCIVPMRLSRYERLSFEAGKVLWRSAPEPGLSGSVGFWFCPHGQGAATLAHARRLLEAFERPLAVDLGPDHSASLTSDLELPHHRLVHVESPPDTPFLVRERGYWTWRGSQPALAGGAWLRVHQQPGDVVQIVAGPSVFARTRPGAGSLRLLALRDPEPRSVEVTVLQPSRLRAPSVVMAADFDEVRLDGEPWAWHDGRTIFLPDRPGTVRIATERFGDRPRPHLRRTGAPITTCRYDPTKRELRWTTARDPDRPAGLPWTAVLAGPEPASIENGEVVPPEQLHLPDPEAELAAARGGVLVRFRPGTTIVRYGEWNDSAAGR